MFSWHSQPHRRNIRSRSHIHYKATLLLSSQTTLTNGCMCAGTTKNNKIIMKKNTPRTPFPFWSASTVVWLSGATKNVLQAFHLFKTYHIYTSLRPACVFTRSHPYFNINVYQTKAICTSRHRHCEQALSKMKCHGVTYVNSHSHAALCRSLCSQQ